MSGAVQKGLDAHTVKEETRINFTRQLLRLREGDVAEATFPNTLSSIERKFLHKLAEELGLKSKSRGKDGNRCITVTKKLNDSSKEAKGTEFYLGGKSCSLLKDNLALIDALNFSQQLSESESLVSVSSTQNKPAPSLDAEANFLESSYWHAQGERTHKPGFSGIQAKRATLPSFHHQAAVCTMVKEHQVVLVSGETGCGKTTQVPQFLLDDPEIGPRCKIIVTQPRRLSAMAVASRIAVEREEKLGGVVGYNIRLEKECSRQSQILFVTPGVLLRKLQSDSTLLEFSHIIVDEAHERDRFAEFLLIVLRDICHKRPSLKLILMSATMHTNKLSSYFGGLPHIHMGGSCFPVQEYFLEHVLRFTDYVKKTSGSEGFRFGGTAVLASYMQAKTAYTCPICCSNRTFYSPEELGTHVALCYGPASQDQNSNKKAEASGGTNKRGKSGSGQLLTVETAATGTLKTLEDLVRALNSSFVNAGGKSSSELNGVGGSSNLTAPTPTEAAQVNPMVDPTAVATTEVDGEPDGDAEDSLDIVDSMLGPGAGADAAVELHTGRIEDDEVGTEALIRQYLFDHDDAQVDYDLILELLRFIFASEFGREGSVLIFMPGWDDISRMFRILHSTPDFGSSTGKFRILQLHSGIPKKSQQEVFEPLNLGQHKIILSTNVAETSITIDDVTVVINTGRVKEKTYDPFVKLAYLKSTWISQASARQRKGRAGRTRAGVCFNLFSRRRHGSLQEFQESELLRMPLEEILLQAKVLGLCPGCKQEPDGLKNFLTKALDPPPELSVINSIQLLQAIGCLDATEALTPLGCAISRLPLDPRIGRAILLGCLFGCGPAAVSAASAMGYRDPFVMPSSEQQRGVLNKVKLDLAQGLPSDQIALLKAIDGFNTVHKRFGVSKASQYCDDRFLSRTTMNYLQDLVDQLIGTVEDIGIRPMQAHATRNNGNLQLIMALIGIAMYPDVGVRCQDSTSFSTEKGRKAKIHPASVNSKQGIYKSPCKMNIELLGYQELVSVASSSSGPGTATLLMLNTTPLSSFALLLTCGTLIELIPGEADDSDENSDEGEAQGVTEDSLSPKKNDAVYLEVDGWLKLKTNAETAQLISAARRSLSLAFQMYVGKPGVQLPQSLNEAVDAIVQVICLEQPGGMRGRT